MKRIFEVLPELLPDPGFWQRLLWLLIPGVIFWGLLFGLIAALYALAYEVPARKLYWVAVGLALAVHTALVWKTATRRQHEKGA